MRDLNIKSCISMLLMLALLLTGQAIHAQDSQANLSIIRGQVLDSYSNPVKGVYITISGQDSVYTVDEFGKFTLQVDENSVVTFNQPDYKPRIVKARKYMEAKRDLNVWLSPITFADPEVIDVLYGQSTREEYLGAASTVYTREIDKTLAQNLMYALPGTMSGFYTQQTSGFRNPSLVAAYNGSLGGNIPVMGISLYSDNSDFGVSLRGQAPVTIVDGIQRDLTSIDIENIESVSVQKDALSSILLGMRSSRGILMVTTKNPEKRGLEVSFTYKTGVESPITLPEPLPAYQYAYLLNEALLNDQKTAAYSATDFVAFRDGTDPVGNPDVNWYNTVLKKNAPSSSYNLNITGGGEVAQYYVNIGYYNREGIFISDTANTYRTNLEYERYLISSKLVINVTDNFKVTGAIMGRLEEGVQPGQGYSSILSSIYTTPNAAYPIYNPNGSYGGNVSFTNNIMSQTVNSGYLLDNGRDVMANINLDYDMKKFVEGLRFFAVANISTQNRTSISRVKRSLVFEFEPGEDGEEDIYTSYGSLSSQSNSFIPVSNLRYFYSQVALEYAKKSGEHALNAKLMADKSSVLVNYELPQQPINIAGQLKYNYANKYYAEGALNYAYFNRYAPEMRWGLFYALGLGWELSKEDFLEQAAWLDMFKLHATFGRTGNGIDNSGYYVYRQSYYSTIFDYSYPQGYSQSIGTATVENNPLANPNLTWEKAYKTDLGTTVAMFRNKLLLDVDVYYDYYYDLLQSRGKSIELLGFNYPAENIGKSLYKGLETSLTFQNNIGEFNYFISGNLSLMKSKVVFIDEQYKQEEYNKLTGQPVGAIFGLVAEGFFNSIEEIENSAVIEGFDIQPGDVKYADLNDDGVVNQYDQTILSTTKPLTWFGVTTGFEYKGFEVSALVQGVFNRSIYVADATLQAGFQAVGQSYGQAYTNMIGRWTPESAETATYPRLTAGGNTYNLNPNYWYSSLWVKDGSYMRLKNVTISYTLPSSITNRLIGAEVKVFVSGQNLYTLSAYRLVDPEVSSFTNYPIMKVISGGVNIKF